VQVTTFARPGSTLLFNLGDPFYFSKQGTNFMAADPVYYLRDAPVVTKHHRDNIIFGVQFKINQPLINAVNKKHLVSLRDKANNFICKEWKGQLQATDNFFSRVLMMEKILIDRLTPKQVYKSRFVNQAARLMERNFRDGYTVTQLAFDMNCSEKTLERYFREYMGMPPKRYSNIIRARAAIQQYELRDMKNKSHLFGYYDHSHFYKERKKIAYDDHAGEETPGNLDW